MLTGSIGWLLFSEEKNLVNVWEYTLDPVVFRLRSSLTPPYSKHRPHKASSGNPPSRGCISSLKRHRHLNLNGRNPPPTIRPVAFVLFSYASFYFWNLLRAFCVELNEQICRLCWKQMLPRWNAWSYKRTLTNKMARF